MTNRLHQIGYRKSDILGKPKELKLAAFTNSDYANNEDRKSITGGVVTVGGVFYIEDISDSEYIINRSGIHSFGNNNTRSSISNTNLRRIIWGGTQETKYYFRR